VPFLLSLILVGLAIFVQLRLEDTPEFQALEAAEDREPPCQGVRSKARSSTCIKKHPKEILLAAGSFVAPNGCFYIIITYSVSTRRELHLPRPLVLRAVLLGRAE
jgi:hypothetical protein